MFDLATANAAEAHRSIKRIVGPTILMGDGLYFDFVQPDAAGMTIEDYAWGLAANNRFSGQTRYRDDTCPGGIGSRVLYNVCQHVVLLAQQMLEDGLPIDAAYEGLMHESDEVVWSDFPGPAKTLMPAKFKDRIKLAGDAIDRRFKVGHAFKDLVKQYDLRMLATEKHALMPHSAADEWQHSSGYEPFPWRITCWSADYAVVRFLDLYRRLARSMGIYRG